VGSGQSSGLSAFWHCIDVTKGWQALSNVDGLLRTDVGIHRGCTRRNGLLMHRGECAYGEDLGYPGTICIENCDSRF
jgi:hypothetical protein